MKLLFILSALSSISSILQLNTKTGGVLLPSTFTVNADSTLSIHSLTSSVYSTYNTGDCFQIELNQIAEYEAKSPGIYVPFPYTTLTDCTFKPTATCTRVSGQIIQIKLTESGYNTLIGTIGKMKNPYSVTPLGVKKLRYYNGCSTTTAQADTSNRIADMSFAPGSITNAVVTNSLNVVGASSSTSVATFTFTPATSFPTTGGKIVFTMPVWYGATTTLQYGFENSGFTCTCSRITSGLSQYPTSAWDQALGALTKSYVIEYTTLSGENSASLSVVCYFFRNPITPITQTGYQIVTKDLSDFVVDVSTSFSLDASSYEPYPVLASAISYTITGSTTVQEQSELTVTLESPLPFEYTGCYLKYTFPVQLPVQSTYLKTYTGGSLMLSSSGGTSRTPVHTDLSSTTQYVIIKGCEHNADTSFIEYTFELKFSDIFLPYAKRTTSAFKIQIYKDYNTATNVLSNEILLASLSTISEANFETNSLSAMTVTASNYAVQESGTHYFKFTTSSAIPSTSGTDIATAIHILFPSTFTQDPSNTGSTGHVTISDISGTIQSYVDTTSDYSSSCYLYLCYRIEFSTSSSLSARTFTMSINNLLNPESVLACGTMTISTMMKYTGDEIFYKIDTLTAASGFKATQGTISSSTMTVSSVYGDFSTYADNQVYDLQYTSKHKVYVGGYVKVFLPGEFTMSSESGCIANFRILGSSGISYASIYQVSATYKYVIGQTLIEMPANTIFIIRVGGLRNPRFLINNSLLAASAKQQFIIKTYDSLTTTFIDSTSIIDYGIGAPIDITTASTLDTFSIEAYNQTNGADSTYLISWFSEIEMKNRDILQIIFPIETILITKDYPMTANRALICEGINGVTRVKCEKDRYNERLLHIELLKVSSSTGLFKVSVDFIRNPASLRGSSPFQSIKIVNQDQLAIASYYGSIAVENYYASDLQNLHSSSVVQTNSNYNEESTYTITFFPASNMLDESSNPLTILLQYPTNVQMVSSDEGCIVKTYSRLYKGRTRTSNPSYCVKMTNSRIYKIEQAIDYGYDQKVEIIINFINPKNNIPTNGFKLKTFEVYYDEDENAIEYLVDQLETNELIPNLKCDFPCEECMGSQIVQNRTFCTSCWQFQSNQYKYLMEFEPYSRSTFGNSTCLTQCPAGYTSNGDTEFHACVKCDESCSTCQDNDLPGDKFRCNTCSESHPFMYAPESKCMVTCDQGFYEVAGTSTCDLCSHPCLDCIGDKYNCTACNLNGTNPAIFVTTRENNGVNVTRQSCRAACPMGYFMDFTDPEYIICNFCNEPCATCEDNGDKCLSCDGSLNRYYLYNDTCFDDCPDYTAPQLTDLICLNCGENCLQCGTMEGPSCYLCAKPYLLEDGLCVPECTKDGFKPNNDMTACINEIYFPIIGPVFTAMSIISTITVLMAKCLYRGTEAIPSIIALVSIWQFLAIGFQIYLCYHFQIKKYFVIACMAGFCLVFLNVFNALYIKYNVRSSNASKKVRLSQVKVQKIQNEIQKKEKRKALYTRDQDQKEEEDGFLEGGTKEIVIDEATLSKHQIFREGKSYYKYSNIEDKGFKKWEDAYDKTAKFISFMALLFNFKFYRMTYSNFLERKQFLVMYQKKKFKKIIVIQTLISMFFVELTMIIGDIVGAVGLDQNQLYYTMCDSFLVCLYLLVLEFIEISRLDKIMKTRNSLKKQANKSAAANPSSEDSQDSDFKKAEPGFGRKKVKKIKNYEDDYPDWRLMLKNIGNENLFDLTPLQLKLTVLEKRFDKRNAESCYDFKTGTEYVDDPRKISSFPSSPMGYDNFDGFDFRVFPKTDDNCYAEARPRLVTPPTIMPPVMVDAFAQAKPSDILQALDRKGKGDLLTPDLDEKDHKRTSGKKRRGRKNHYHQQIDAEDFDQLNPQEELAKGDTLDSINEDQDESDEERLRQEIEAEDKRIRMLLAEENERGLMKTEEERKRKVDIYEKGLMRQKIENDQRETREFEEKEKEVELELHEKEELQEKENQGDKKKVTEQQEKEEGEKKTRVVEEILREELQEKKELEDKEREQIDEKKREQLEKMKQKEIDEKQMEMLEDQKRDELEELKSQEHEEQKSNDIEEQKSQELEEQKRDELEQKKISELEEQRTKDLEEQRIKIEQELLQQEEEAIFEDEGLQKQYALQLQLQDELDNHDQETIDAEDFQNAILNETASIRPPSPIASNRTNLEHSSSNLSQMMVKSNAIISFKGKVDEQIIEVPPTNESRRFNENDILGNLDRDEKGNILTEQDRDGNYTDLDGTQTNQRGYLTDDKGDVINNFNQKQMFPSKDIDERGELPAPFNIEKYNFNPHKVRGNFEYDRNGNPKIQKNKFGDHVDRNGAIVTSRGYKIDQNSNIIDYDNRKKFDKCHLISGDLPKLYNYDGKRFDIKDVIGRVNVDRKGTIQHQMDKQGNIIDNIGRAMNSKGYLIDEFENVIDKDSKIIFSRKHLLEDEIPKIFPFTRFNIQNVQGDYEFDPLGVPILDRLENGEFRDRKGKKVNEKGYLIDGKGNVINKNGKVQFMKNVLDDEGEIPKVFRTGLLKSNTGSSLSGLISELGHQQLSEFDELEQKFAEAEEILKGKKRSKSGDTSMDSLMEDTPANYNYQNQGFGDETLRTPRNHDLQLLNDETDLDYGDELSSNFGSLPQVSHTNRFDLLNKRKKQKKIQKLQKVDSKWEDPNIREVLMAGAYGGVAKKKIKRNGVLNTNDIYQGLQDIPVPTGNHLLARKGSKQMSNYFDTKNSLRRDSSRVKLREQLRRIDSGSEFGSHYGSSRKNNFNTGNQSSAIQLAAASSLLDQGVHSHSTQLIDHKSRDLLVKKNNLLRKNGVSGSKDQEFEQLFGQDIDEFLDNSQWDIASADGISRHSKDSNKSTKLRGLENIYLKRMDSTKATIPNIKPRLNKFRENGEKLMNTKSNR